MAYLYVAAGLTLLLVGAELLVRGAVALAEQLDVSPLMIGLTIVAWGTTAPELLVSVEASLQGFPGIAIGNVVGSNIANVLLILGTAGLIFPIACRRGLLRRDGTVMLGACVLFTVFALCGTVMAWQGILLIALLLIVSGLAYISEKRGNGAGEVYAQEAEAFEDGPRNTIVAVGFVLGGLACVVGGAHLLIDGAVLVARALGVSETVIGLTMVAVGTSLPELATAVVAAWRKHPEVAIGNVIGANTYNILGIIGVVSILQPLDVPQQILNFDIWIMLAACGFVLAWMMFICRLGRPVALVMLLAYGLFTAAQFFGWAAEAAPMG